MKFDIILAGVGGQGVLSLSAVIAAGAMREGLSVKQSEVHGMSQRGGAVVAHLRISDSPVASDLIPRGSAAMILSMEPLECLRYIEYLAADGTVVTATAPSINIPDYPEIEGLLARIRALGRSILIDAEEIARKSGSAQAVNMVLAGAASLMLPVRAEAIEESIREIFGNRGERVVETNLSAFRAGRAVKQ